MALVALLVVLTFPAAPDGEGSQTRERAVVAIDTDAAASGPSVNRHVPVASASVAALQVEASTPNTLGVPAIAEDRLADGREAIRRLQARRSMPHRSSDDGH